VLTVTDVEAAHALGDYLSNIFIKEGEYKPENIENVYVGLSTITVDRNTVMRSFRWTEPDDRTTFTVHSAVLKNCAEIVPIPLVMIYEKLFQVSIPPTVGWSIQKLAIPPTVFRLWLGLRSVRLGSVGSVFGVKWVFDYFTRLSLEVSTSPQGFRSSAVGTQVHRPSVYIWLVFGHFGLINLVRGPSGE